VLLAIAPWIQIDIALVLAGFCAIGALDDYRGLRPAMKAVLLVPPSAAAVWFTGEIWIGPACWASANALNMLDHADGTAASTCAVSLFVADGALGPSGAGASLGFLTHNWPPARTFLGDSGSLMLGALLVLAWSPQGPIATLGGTAVPLIDAAFVVIRRIRNRQVPWIGGTDHTGHELLRRGVNPRYLPLVYGLAASAAALLGVAWT
jgi:UDP-GlcNAc:undecaprenyl-phosphate GlcNAc-1-phosphate transferase